MKAVLYFGLGWLFILASGAIAGPLYGTVRLGQAPAAQVNVVVTCPNQPPTGATTDARGSFSLLVPTSGRCRMRVERGNQKGGEFEVFVSDNPMRFDVVLDGALNRVR